MSTIALKTLPEYFGPILRRIKTFEIRWDDRGFKVHDFLHLREWDGDKYTGRECWRHVTYVLSSKEFPGVAPGYVVMGLS